MNSIQTVKDHYLLSLYANLARAVEIALLGKHNIYISFENEDEDKRQAKYAKAEIAKLTKLIESLRIPNIKFSITVYDGPGENVMHIELHPPKFETMVQSNKYEELVVIAERVLKASTNPIPTMPDSEYECQLLMRRMYEKDLPWVFAYNNAWNIAVTIAQLDNSDKIRTEHIAEAIQYQLI